MERNKWEEFWHFHKYKLNETSPFRGLPTMERMVLDNEVVSCFPEPLLFSFSERRKDVSSCEHTIKKYPQGARSEDLIISFNLPKPFKVIYSIYTSPGFNGERSFDCLGNFCYADELKELSDLYDRMHTYMEAYSYHRVKLATNDMPFYMHCSKLYDWRKQQEDKKG